MTDLEELQTRWQAAWPDAILAWSRYLMLRPPTFCLTNAAAKREGLSGSFAMIRLVDQSVIVNLPEVIQSGVEDYPLEILAHEVGHHVLAPATLTDHARTISRMRWSLPTMERHAAMVANLYTDLLINDRLQRSAGLRMADVYRKLRPQKADGALWLVYMRIYEILWGLRRGSLAHSPLADAQEGDAHLGSRLIRSYAHDWLEGAGRFAALLLPYLLEDSGAAESVARLLDTRDAARNGDIDGLSEEQEGERAGAVHPASELNAEPIAVAPSEEVRPQQPSGQTRQPFEYGDILRAAGMIITDEDAAMRYYKEKARPHLVPFPSRPSAPGEEPLPEGLEPWSIGDPLDTVDWLQSVLTSPRPIPGLTTVSRVWGTTQGRPQQPEPLFLDLYVDSSGSMLDPRRLLSFPTLAGAIIALSALRAGASIQATLWSGTHQCAGTSGFVRDERAILAVLTGYFGGATAFPLHRMRDTYEKRTANDRPVHLMVISDDGISTMFQADERGNDGWALTREALAKARGGGTLVLNLPANWEQHCRTHKHPSLTSIARARDELGLQVACVTVWDELTAFARAWSKQTYASQKKL